MLAGAPVSKKDLLSQSRFIQKKGLPQRKLLLPRNANTRGKAAAGNARPNQNDTRNWYEYDSEVDRVAEKKNCHEAGGFREQKSNFSQRKKIALCETRGKNKAATFCRTLCRQDGISKATGLRSYGAMS